MAKITTAVCKKFLVDCVKADPTILYGRVQDREEVVREGLKEKSWQRELKFNPNGSSEHVEESYGTYDGGWMDAKDLKAVRRFILSPHLFEGAVIFYVLEDNDGVLILGDDLGD